MARIPREVRLFRLYGAPVIVHWSVALIFPIAWFIHRQAADAIASFFAYFVVILTHEIGHAWVARHYGCAVFAFHLYPLHGLCQYERPFLESQRIAIAWGGVAAQALLMATGITITEMAAFGGMTLPSSLDSSLMVWVVINLMILLFNLCPVPPLDGATAWRVLPFMWKRWRTASSRLQPPTPKPIKPRLSSANRGSKVVAFDRSRRNRDNQL